jgi:uncharacterized protein (DUF342 family)
MALLDHTNINESHLWLSWRISPDGTFLTVLQEHIPERWDIKEIRKTLLKNKVLVFDIAKIESVIRSASGQEERIGDPFELFQESKRKYMYIQATPAQVRFSIHASVLQAGFQITMNDVLFILAEKAVVYGIDYDTLEEILSKGLYGKEFIIASATLPIAGKDAVIAEVLPIDPDAKPFLNEDGSVDYKKWDNIRQIKEGEVICTRTPPTPGIPGISVYGMPLSPTSGEDYALPKGVNTKTINNETKLVASIDGFLYRQGYNICVGGIYIVKGDVNFKTGNIEYFGDILIRGNVTAGFSVIAGGNVSIEGIVESAYIESKEGNVFLKGSVFGLNNANIIAKKNINAQNIQDTKIKTGQTLTVRRQIRNCKIEAENVEMPHEGHIISSTVAFRGHVKCGNIGGKSGAVNEFIFVEDERRLFKEELQKLNELLQKLNQAIEVLQAKIFSIKSSDITPELDNQKKLLTSQMFTCDSSREQLTAKRKKLLRILEFMPDKDALITTYLLSPILKISIFGSSKEFKQELANLKISWKGGAIRMESI